MFEDTLNFYKALSKRQPEEIIFMEDYLKDSYSLIFAFSVIAI